MEGNDGSLSVSEGGGEFDGQAVRWTRGRVRHIGTSTGQLYAIHNPDVLFSFALHDIDIGPFWDASREQWSNILLEGDEVLFTAGPFLDVGSSNNNSEGNILRLAERILIPETTNDDGSYLGVVLRSRHPFSRENAIAAVLCPPFGVIMLHRFAFGFDDDFLKGEWPLAPGRRIFLLVDSEDPSRVSEVLGWADGKRFCVRCRGCSEKSPSFLPPIYRYQYERLMERRGMNDSNGPALPDPAEESAAIESAISVEECCLLSERATQTDGTDGESQSFGNRSVKERSLKEEIDGIESTNMVVEERKNEEEGMPEVEDIVPVLGRIEHSHQDSVLNHSVAVFERKESQRSESEKSDEESLYIGTDDDQSEEEEENEKVEEDLKWEAEEETKRTHVEEAPDVFAQVLDVLKGMARKLEDSKLTVSDYFKTKRSREVETSNVMKDDELLNTEEIPVDVSTTKENGHDSRPLDGAFEIVNDEDKTTLQIEATDEEIEVAEMVLNDVVDEVVKELEDAERSGGGLIPAAIEEVHAVSTSGEGFHVLRISGEEVRAPSTSSEEVHAPSTSGEQFHALSSSRERVCALSTAEGLNEVKETRTKAGQVAAVDDGVNALSTSEDASDVLEGRDVVVSKVPLMEREVAIGNCDAKSVSAVDMLSELLNDPDILGLVLKKHRDTFREYIRSSL